MIQKQVLEILLNKIKTDYKDDIAILVMHGSMIYHATHEKSDLDIYFIPKTERGYKLGFVFVLNDIGYDIWPISWERITAISNHNEKITSIITEGHVLYHASDEDLMRFEALKWAAKDQSRPNHYHQQAKITMGHLYQPLYLMMQSDDIKDIRTYGIEIINGLCHIISLINLTMIQRGRAHLKSEVLLMKKKPAHFKDFIDTVFDTNDINTIKSNYQKLFDETKRLLCEVTDTLSSVDVKHNATGFYEEIINHYNKIERAYQIGDIKTALFAAVEIEHEVKSVIRHDHLFKDMPSLTLSYDQDDLSKLYQTSKKHQKMLLEILDRHQVPIQSFKDIKAFKNHIDSL